MIKTSYGITHEAAPAVYKMNMMLVMTKTEMDAIHEPTPAVLKRFLMALMCLCVACLTNGEPLLWLKVGPGSEYINTVLHLQIHGDLYMLHQNLGDA